MKNLYIFAGVNGAGKSTFYVNQIAKNDKIQKIINKKIFWFDNLNVKA
ncbi:hypothetical protein IO424_001806 [Campylobacter fetus]|nr:hypothetical protein [Campylobacter fetus]EDO9794469.1 hypothetical protein [Campylobacter fetus]EGK8073930.1 hypothetical protein [Campylobacter fetus]EJU9540115.1 hypothetical protein [Campylobacter fetus]WKW18220.1 hypothetical protein IXZ25_03430 [Campylobacter fetus subsp. fetus]HDX6332425.1 hypothetical protein [Campylobacter fetus]